MMDLDMGVVAKVEGDQIIHKQGSGANGSTTIASLKSSV